MEYGKQASGGDVRLVASKRRKKRHEWSFGLTILPRSLLQTDEVRVVLVRLARSLCCFIAFLCFRCSQVANAAQSTSLPNHQLNCIATKTNFQKHSQRGELITRTPALRYHRVTFWSACTLQIFKNPRVRFTGTQHARARTHTPACLSPPPHRRVKNSCYITPSNMKCGL